MRASRSSRPTPTQGAVVHDVHDIRALTATRPVTLPNVAPDRAGTSARG